MTLQGTVEIDGKKQSVKADKIELSLSPETGASAVASMGGGMGTTVRESISMNGSVLVTSVSVTTGDKTTTTTTTSNSSDGSSTTTTTTTDGSGTTTEIKINRK